MGRFIILYLKMKFIFMMMIVFWEVKVDSLS